MDFFLNIPNSFDGFAAMQIFLWIHPFVKIPWLKVYPSLATTAMYSATNRLTFLSFLSFSLPCRMAIENQTSLSIHRVSPGFRWMIQIYQYLQPMPTLWFSIKLGDRLIVLLIIETLCKLLVLQIAAGVVYFSSHSRCSVIRWSA